MAILKRKSRPKVKVENTKTKKRESTRLAYPANTWQRVQTEESWRREKEACL